MLALTVSAAVTAAVLPLAALAAARRPSDARLDRAIAERLARQGTSR